jgi:soluble lytic murein transglycosylase-like protein
MRSVNEFLLATARTLILAILLSGMAWAQGLQTATQSGQPDVFAGWHATLNDAADRTLAAAVADRSWMKTPEVAVGVASPSISAIDPLVRVRTAIQRVQQLQPTIEPILQQEGVPTELSAVVLVESGGLLTALSPKGARGVWQFMPDTARRYGLTVSNERDDRVELVRSTRAAAHYLRDLYQQFGDWQLAFAAYNAGEQRVQRAVARTGLREFSAISPALPLETQNYVPAVLNAIAALGGQPEGVARITNSSRPARGRLMYASAANSY